MGEMEQAQKAAQKAENAGGGGDAARRDQSVRCTVERCGRVHSDHEFWVLYTRVLPSLGVLGLLLWLLERLGL